MSLRSKLLKAIGCPAPEKIFEPNWFATRNFHGQWYTDSDLLEGYLHFRSNQTCDDYFKWMASQVPWYFHLARSSLYLHKTGYGSHR